MGFHTRCPDCSVHYRIGEAHKCVAAKPRKVDEVVAGVKIHEGDPVDPTPAQLSAERWKLLDRLDEISGIIGPMTAAEKQRRYRERKRMGK